MVPQGRSVPGHGSTLHGGNVGEGNLLPPGLAVVPETGARPAGVKGPIRFAQTASAEPCSLEQLLDAHIISAPDRCASAQGADNGGACGGSCVKEAPQR